MSFFHYFLFLRITSKKYLFARILKVHPQIFISVLFVNTDITSATSPDESTTVASDNPCSPIETSAAAPTNEQQEQEKQQQQPQQQQLYQHNHPQFQQQQQRTTGSAPAAALHVAEDSGAPCEMRRTPPQNKGEFVYS